jgi:hypothetical protein
MIMTESAMNPWKAMLAETQLRIIFATRLGSKYLITRMSVLQKSSAVTQPSPQIFSSSTTTYTTYI